MTQLQNRMTPDEQAGYQAACQSGYGTILGYQVGRGVYPEDLGREHVAPLAKMAKREGWQRIAVKASPAERAVKIMKVWSYPLHALQAQLG